jgi:hypothetical protein
MIPGLLTKENLNKTKHPKKDKRKLLLLVKILQHLANGTLFTDEKMKPLNEWMSFHSPVFSKLI